MASTRVDLRRSISSQRSPTPVLRRGHPSTCSRRLVGVVTRAAAHSVEGVAAVAPAASASPQQQHAAGAVPAPPSSSQQHTGTAPSPADTIKLNLHVAHVEVDGEAMPKVGGGVHPDMRVEPRALVPLHHPEAVVVDAAAAADADADADAAPTVQQQQQHEQQQHHHHHHNRRQHHNQHHNHNQHHHHEQQPWQRHPRFGERLELRLAVGDVVWGHVVSSDRQAGARVRVLGHEGVVGFVPAGGGRGAAAPAAVAHAGPPPLGDVRAFVVRGLPERATFCGRGPLLSACDADEALLWRRAEQLLELCRDEHEAVTVTVTGHNSGGLRASLLGLRAFIPFSTLVKGAGEVCDAAAMVGRQLSASVIECDRATGALTLSEKAARSARALAALQPGALALGTVVGVEPRAAKVRLDGVGSGPLAVLHVSKFSCDYTRNLQDHLAPGDRVVAIVLAPARGHRGAELSTAHLEVAAGDMLREGGPARVYATADRQAALVRAQMAEAAAAAAEQPWCEPAGAAAEEGAWAAY